MIQILVNRFLIGLFLAILSAGCAGPQPEQKGEQALVESRPRDSIDYFKEQLQHHPSDARARNNLAVAYMRVKNYDAAFNELNKVIAQTPDDATAHYNLALVYYFKGLVNMEIEAYRKTIRLAPTHYGAHLNLGHALLEKGEKKEAVTQYRWVLVQTPENTKVLFNLALLYRDLNEKEKAIPLLKKFLEVEPEGKYSVRAKQYLSELTRTAPGTDGSKK